VVRRAGLARRHGRPVRAVHARPGHVRAALRQAIFEGLKAYRQPDGSIACFRPDANAQRFQTSAERLAMPKLPEDVFIESIRELLAVDSRWCPPGRVIPCTCGRS